MTIGRASHEFSMTARLLCHARPRYSGSWERGEQQTPTCYEIQRGSPFIADASDSGSTTLRAGKRCLRQDLAIADEHDAVVRNHSWSCGHGHRGSLTRILVIPDGEDRFARNPVCSRRFWPLAGRVVRRPEAAFRRNSGAAMITASPRHLAGQQRYDHRLRELVRRLCGETCATALQSADENRSQHLRKEGTGSRTGPARW